MASPLRSFRAATWNVLADAYTRTSYFPTSPAACLETATRFAAITASLRSMHPLHVLCLQELDHFDDHWRDTLGGLGLELHFAPRPSPKQDGCLIAFDPAKFARAGEPRVVEFDALARDFPADADRLTRANVGLLLPLRERESDARLLVATTHLYWNPAHEVVKVAQMAKLLNEMAECAEAMTGEGPVHLLLCGDFNSTPDSDVMRLVEEGEVEPRWQPPNERQLLLDKPLQRAGRMLRAVGIDTDIYEGDSDGLLEAAGESQRLLVTPNKQLLNRRDCPPGSVFVPAMDAESTFTFITKELGINREHAAYYTRCLQCNTSFEQFTAAEVQDRDEVPHAATDALASNPDLPFYRCGTCNRMYWWGEATENAVQSYEALWDRIEASAAKDPSEETQEDASLAHQGIAYQRFTQPLTSLTSVFAKSPPLRTTRTCRFDGTIDYIYSSGLAVLSACTVPESSSIETDLPNETWPSDHIAVVAELSFKT